MVVKFDAPVTRMMDVDEYHDFVREEIDLEDFDCLCETAWALKCLANNRTFLTRAVNTELGSYLAGRCNNAFNANSVILFRARDYTVRANLWLPLSTDRQRQALEATAFSYFACHDHNFHFVTAGYLGSGYESLLYHQDRMGAEQPGDRVSLAFIEKIRLGQGDLMAYRAFADAHTQEPPEEFSVSLNLMAHPPGLASHRQYFFDVEAETISTAVGNGHESFANFIGMAGELGNGNTVELLLDLARDHPIDTIRVGAADALARLCPQETAYFHRVLPVDARSQSTLSHLSM